MPRVVVIEDEPDMIELIRLILTRKGMTVIGAQGGREGIRTVVEQQPDLVLLDLMMPDIDGWDVYRELKADSTTRTIPVIVVTAKAQSSEKEIGLRIAKVDDYIVKPFGPTQLLESIERVFARNL